MKKRIFKFIKYAFFLGLAFLLFLVFIPRSYNVPKFQKRVGTQFWDLPTGSKIGYTFIPAKGIQKPFPIIFLNGGPGGCITNAGISLRSQLADDGFDVYLYDQIGSGQSERLKDITEYTADRHKKDLEEMIKKIGAEKVILIGQSWGAILAVLYAAENQGKIQKIIFTCPGPIYPVRQELATIKAPDSLNLHNPIFTNAQGNKKANNVRSNAMAFCATIFGKKMASDKEADDFETYLDYEVNKSTVHDTSKIGKAEPGGGFYASIMTMNSLRRVQDPRPKIKNSTIPILVMRAQYDNQKWGFTNEYCELFPNHQLIIIPNAGHAISTEQPALYLKIIRDFLKE